MSQCECWWNSSTIPRTLRDRLYQDRYPHRLIQGTQTNKGHKKVRDLILSLHLLMWKKKIYIPILLLAVQSGILHSGELRSGCPTGNGQWSWTSHLMGCDQIRETVDLSALYLYNCILFHMTAKGNCCIATNKSFKIAKADIC